MGTSILRRLISSKAREAKLKARANVATTVASLVASPVSAPILRRPAQAEKKANVKAKSRGLASRAAVLAYQETAQKGLGQRAKVVERRRMQATDGRSLRPNCCAA